MAKEVYVENLPYEIDEDGIRRLFKVSGTVVSIHLITDPKSGNFRGAAHVKMATSAEAADAIESLDGAIVENRPITVTRSRTKAERLLTQAAPQKPPKKGTPRSRR